MSFLKALFSQKMLTCILCGFSSGLPYFIVVQMLPAWLKDSGVSIQEIGLFSLTTLPYAFKFLWAPLLDLYIPPFLGRRRGWAIVAQIILLLIIGSFALCSPEGRCECAADSDCTEGADQCFGGQCGCSSIDVCADAVHPGTMVVCSP